MTRIATVALSIIALASIGVRIDVPHPTQATSVPSAATARTSAGETSTGGASYVETVPVEPQVVGATAEQLTVIAWALDRYDEAGLELPPLLIEVHNSTEGCDGNRGIHLSGGRVDIIHLCDTSTPVVLHELAHAWTAHHASDEVREAFLVHEGVAHWAGAAVPYDGRGTERASRTMSLCLAERPLSTNEALLYARYLDGYEILTGSPSPRLVSASVDGAVESRTSR